MSVFGSYADYYDLLYADKNYQAEVEYLDAIIKQDNQAATSILELGCGTGAHAQVFAQKGYTIHGIDFSQKMINIASKKFNHNSSVTLDVGDVRTYRTSKQYDVVLSLFHVINYQITDSDLQKMVQTAAVHTKPGGLFIFDCWYGPAVLSQKPEVRVKRIKIGDVELTRLSEPKSYPEKNKVDVTFTLFVRDKKNHAITELSETHGMRYLFKPEIENLFEQNSFSCTGFYEWMTSKAPVSSSWGVCVVGKKK